MGRIWITLPDGPQGKELSAEIHRMVFRAFPEKKKIIDLLQDNPGKSLTKLETLLRHQGIRCKKETIRNYMEKCGFPYNDQDS